MKIDGAVRISWRLVAIDILVLLIFGVAGIGFHHVGGDFVQALVRIVLPFALGLLSIGFLVGAYQNPASAGGFALRSLLLWLLGIGAGLLLRGLQRGVVPNLLFMQITLVFCGVLMLLGRTAFWFLHRRPHNPPRS